MWRVSRNRQAAKGQTTANRGSPLRNVSALAAGEYPVPIEGITRRRERACRLETVEARDVSGSWPAALATLSWIRKASLSSECPFLLDFGTLLNNSEAASAL